MLGIQIEFAVFNHAILTGIFIVSVYLGLRVLRRLIGHALWVINLEDVLYWIFAAGYLFVQIYHTSDGMIRWYFVLGLVIGMLIMKFSAFLAKKIDKKISTFLQRKSGKKS
ncbi:MAG: hypothetical protein HFG41_06620 [Coprococcus sp.]|nr:hypothetical protein [Coprococcus sp.]